MIRRPQLAEERIASFKRHSPGHDPKDVLLASQTPAEQASHLRSKTPSFIARIPRFPDPRRFGGVKNCVGVEISVD